MSRTHNERSVPNARGRKGEKKGKRRGHKRARGIPLNDDLTSVKFTYSGEVLDRETKQKDIGKYY